jgi:hypothetical protein
MIAAPDVNHIPQKCYGKMLNFKINAKIRGIAESEEG